MFYRNSDGGYLVAMYAQSRVLGRGYFGGSGAKIVS